ncbi:alpha-2-macroglobulin family protein, partial [Raoultella planticola]|uniref:alpha-2-macroglobulin family protein n=1 Tax=Raoultella planticola TaxID=575 RepID=UPI001F5E4E9C
TADDFGSSEDKVVVAAPVIAELNTPRFLASGDTTRLALDLSNLTDKPQTLQVHLTASGLVTLTECQLPPVQLAPGARSTLFIPVSALAGFGDGQVNATISGLCRVRRTHADFPLFLQRGEGFARQAQAADRGVHLAIAEARQRAHRHKQRAACPRRQLHRRQL